MIRKRITCYGRVQGVGFRYRAQHAARGLMLTGWVRNESDGSVLMEVQGSEEQITRLLQMIRQGRYIEIDAMQMKEIPIQEDERGFQVSYSGM